MQIEMEEHPLRTTVFYQNIFILLGKCWHEMSGDQRFIEKTVENYFRKMEIMYKIHIMANPRQISG